MFDWLQGYIFDSKHNQLLFDYLKDKSKVIKWGQSLALSLQLVTVRGINYTNLYLVLREIFLLKQTVGLSRVTSN